MNDSPQRLAAFQLLDKAGVWKSNYAPPIFRLLWRIGLNLPPPHFMSIASSAALTGTFFGVFWGIFMYRFAATTGDVKPSALLFSALCAGVLFGASMAAYYAFGRRKYKLPKWSSLPQANLDDA